ncbi:MAG: DUF1508 domain-containing protein [Arcicella sp.]|nr:DUF1508 domain-containing protein [Arcicella sp.]
MKFLVTQQEDGKFSFTLSDNDSNLVLSSINFTDRDACITAIRALTQDLPTRANYQTATENGRSIFNVVSGGQIVAFSPAFASSNDASEAADSLSEDTSDEPNYSVEVKTFSTSTTTTTREQVVLPALGEIDFASLYDFTYASPKGTPGFETFNRKDKNASYFHFNDANGQALLYSRSFDANSKREKRIRQVIGASAKTSRFEIKENGGSFYFILKERNNLEIARSRSFGSRTEAETQVAFVQANVASYASDYPEPVKRKSVNQYDFEILPSSEGAGFDAVRGRDKQHYFLLKNDAGTPILYSQGYGTSIARDNGIKTTIKNGIEETRYEKIEKDGQYSFTLRAGNRQEIAKSPTFESKAERDTALDWLLANTRSYSEKYGVVYDTKEVITENTESFTIDMPAPVVATSVVATSIAEPEVETKPNSTDMQIDEYLPCESYAGHTDSPAENFRIFQNAENNEHYFTMLSKTGKVVFRSEGYPTMAARDNGLASVQKNSEIRERYSTIEEDGKHYVILKAGNHQEIARSCPYDSAEGMYGLFPFMAAGSMAALSFDDTPVVAAVAEANADKLLDNYLPCDDYAGHSDSPAEGIRTFKSDKDGQYYFSMIDGDGNVSMRSEGYPTVGARDNGVASVLKNRDNKDRYAEIEEDGVHYVILKAGNGQEIARSCPSSSKIGLLGFLPLIGAGALGLGGMAAVAAAIPEIKVAPPIVEVPKVVPPVVKTPQVAPLAMAEPEIEAAAGGLPKWLLPLLGLVLLALLAWWLLKSCKTETPAAAVATTPEMVDTAKVETAVKPAPVGEQMDGFTPVILYFDNDEPNKNSQATTTGLNYTQTFDRYEARKGKFEGEADSPEAKTAIAGFFDNEVKKGMDDLNSLAAMIVKNLDAGEKVNITVKGFASPLAKNDYNVNLTKRRISSIRNFLSKYDGGKLSKMMDKITVTEQPNGEDSSASGLSDDEKNTKLSIYDLGPSKERRVEIMDVRFVKE